MNKKAQLDYPIITFIVIVVGLLLIAPIGLKIFTSIQAPMSNSFGNLSGQGGVIAQTNFNKVINTGITFWDKIIVFAFFIGVIMMFISAFLIDVHPFWLILYIFISFITILFAPDIVGSLNNIYDSSTFAGEVTQLTFMDFIRLNFGEILVGIMVITGIIIYGKIRFFSGSDGGRR